MKTYEVKVPVERRAFENDIYKVEAESKKEALRKVKESEAEFLESEPNYTLPSEEIDICWNMVVINEV